MISNNVYGERGWLSVAREFNVPDICYGDIRLPSKYPAILYTAPVTDCLSPRHIRMLEHWDVIVLPNTWSLKVFSSISTHMVMVPIPIQIVDADRPERFTYLLEGDQLSDLMDIVEIFKVRMPSDVYLVVKTSGENTVRIMLDDNVEWIHADINQQTLYSQCHVGIHSADGLGYRLLSQMGAGMCVISPYWGPMENLLYYRQCEYKQVFSIDYGWGQTAEVDTDSLFNQLIWAYENQDEAAELGDQAKSWVRRFQDTRNQLKCIPLLYQPTVTPTD